MNKNWIIKRILVLATLFTAIQGFAQAALILSAPPRETAQVGQEQYGVLAKKLSQLLDTEVVYKHPDNWTQYAAQMRSGKYDIVFDGPHFAAWRMKHVNHIPVARLPGSLKFLIIARADDKNINTMRDLIGRNICGPPSPNLATMAVFAIFDNPVIQPEIKVIKGNMRNVVKAFFHGECSAAVVRDKMLFSLPKEKQDKVKLIATSDNMPNQTITVSTKISLYNREKIQRFLTSPDGAKTADKLLSTYSRANKVFLPVKLDEYTSMKDMIEGVVFGW
jgi:ABC-type phosphate/phosphonate transport system substrate-binding protein